MNNSSTILKNKLMYLDVQSRSQKTIADWGLKVGRGYRSICFLNSIFDYLHSEKPWVDLETTSRRRKKRSDSRRLVVVFVYKQMKSIFSQLCPLENENLTVSTLFDNLFCQPCLFRIEKGFLWSWHFIPHRNGVRYVIIYHYSYEI